MLLETVSAPDAPAFATGKKEALQGGEFGKAGMHQPPPGPTPERLKRSRGYFEIGGDRRIGHRFKMLDNPLGRAWVRQKISGEEFTGLKKYALHWFAGGLEGHLGSVDLNRILAFDPASMTGLAKTEAQADHRQEYYQARAMIGRRPAFVADAVACFEFELVPTGRMLGYRSNYRAREAALDILRDAGYRLAAHWRDRPP